MELELSKESVMEWTDKHPHNFSVGVGPYLLFIPLHDNMRPKSGIKPWVGLINDEKNLGPK